MLTDDETLSEAAEAVLEDVTALPKTNSRTELDERRVKTRDDISRLVRASSAGRAAPQAHQMRRGTAGNHGECGLA
jgi:hypothetical protein